MPGPHLSAEDAAVHAFAERDRHKAINVLLVQALEQAQQALDGVIRSAGQSTAGWLAGRRQVAKAEIAVRAALTKAKEAAA